MGQDSGFDEPEADRFSEISTNSPQGSVASSYNPSIAPGVPLTDEHLSKHNMTLAESGKTKPGVAGAPDDDDDGSSTTTSDDFKSVPTVRGENTGSHLPSVATSQSPYNIRDELEEMSVVLSNIDENDDQTLEKIHGNLTRLQQVMLEVYRARQEAQGRPPDLSLELERQIEALFIQIRETLHSIGNEDERILRGQNPTITNAKGQTGLHLALRKEPTDVALIKRFIELGASLTALDNEGNTPLLSLLTYSNFLEDGKLQQIKVKQAFDSFLRASAASDIGINAATNDGAAALHLLANCNTNVEFIRALVNRGADINVRHRRKESWTPLHVAASSQNATIVVAVLISCGADVNASSSTGDSPLHQSLSGASWFPERSVEQLLLAGAASDSSNIALRRPLDLALKLLSLYERRLASLQDDDWWWATASMEVRHISEMLCIIDMLFQRILELSIHRESSSVIATTYTFEEVGDLDRIAIPQLRALFRRRRVEILVKTKRELYEDLKMWYRIP